jgi:hypothetical protein
MHLSEVDVTDVSEKRNASILEVEVYSSTLIRSSEKFMHFNRTTRRHKPDDHSSEAPLWEPESRTF